MTLASDSFEQCITFNDWSPVQWVDIDMILTSLRYTHEAFNDCSPVQWVNIEYLISYHCSSIVAYSVVI